MNAEQVLVINSVINNKNPRFTNIYIHKVCNGLSKLYKNLETILVIIC